MDDDDKVRRNLTVFSASVLAVEYFGLQVGEVFQHSLHLSQAVSPLKLSVAGLAVLAYLGLRYKDATLMSDLKYADAVAFDLKIVTPTVVHHYAQLMMNLYKWTGYEPSLFVINLKEYCEFQAAGNPIAVNNRPTIYVNGISIENQLSGQGRLASDIWNVGTSIVWIKGNQSQTIGGGRQLQIKAKGIHLILIWIYSRIWWFFLSEGAIRARTPVLAGLAAALVLSNKIITVSAS